MERPEEALEAFRRAQKLGSSGAAISLDLGRAYLQMYRFEEAERAFAEAVRAAPGDPDAQLHLARARFMGGDPAYARDLIAAAETLADDPRVAARFGILLTQVGLFERAERHFEMLLRRHGRSPEALSALARLQLEIGRPGKARPLVVDALRARPDDACIADTAVAVLLGCGEPELASWYVAKYRKRRPLDQGWIAYEAVVARLLDPDRYRQLYDFDRLVRVYDLEAPGAWASMAEMGEALQRVLAARHRSPTLPVDESLRHGSRTTRSLLTDPDAVIQAILKAFEAPLADYCRALGTDAGHPVSARNVGGARLADAWSVQLGNRGYHVNHFHRAGWITSAYYVTTPDEVKDADRMPGWIRVGEPRFAVPGANAERFIQPVPGRLVLFPACMWHGTNAIDGPGPRTTISFDAMPA
jgi:tetratricopeptide (TPR) repeat protein